MIPAAMIKSAGTLLNKFKNDEITLWPINVEIARNRENGDRSRRKGFEQKECSSLSTACFSQRNFRNDNILGLWLFACRSFNEPPLSHKNPPQKAVFQKFMKSLSRLRKLRFLSCYSTKCNEHSNNSFSNHSWTEDLRKFPPAGIF